MSDLAVPGVAYAEANWGKWIARCPRPGCTNALRLDRDQAMFMCGGPDSCGLEAPVVWPADPDAIETVLTMRMFSRTRSWVPGETIEDLLAENAAHDCLPPEWLALAEAGERALLVQTADQRVVGGLLYHQLEAAGRREIGA